MAALGLRVSWVLDLYPAASIVFVDAQLALGDDALQIPSANLLKESLAMVLDVLRVEDDLHKGTYTVRRKPDVGFNPKTHESRTVKLPSSLVDELKHATRKPPTCDGSPHQSTDSPTVTSCAS
jgi:hypothetical protein